MKTQTKLVLLALFTATAIGTMQFVGAAVPDGLNYQAYLTNNDGTAVDADVSVTFAAYNVAVGGVPLWSQTQTVTVDQGLFSITLGDPINPFPPGLFDDAVYIGLFVAGEELLPRRPLTTAAYSFKASDANTLEGATAASLDQSSEVSALEGDISTIEGGLTAIDGRVTTLEAIGADITGVGAGAGLTGGGASGNVTVSVAPGGINATMIGANSVGGGAIIDGSVTAADIATNAVGAAEIQPNAVGASELATNSVTSIDIANGTIGPADIDAGAAFTFGGITSNLGPVDLNGALTIDSTADIRIYDNFNGFRWYDNDETTQFAALEINESSVSFRDYNQGRYLIYSNSNGVGINTTSTSAAYGVTVPSLNVLGDTNVGYERVSAIYALDSMSASCHSHGNLPCYYGSISVFCPAGKQVLGGGSTGTSGLFGSVSRSGPSGTTGWQCAASYDLANVSRTCYAMCARLE